MGWKLLQMQFIHNIFILIIIHSLYLFPFCVCVWVSVSVIDVLFRTIYIYIKNLNNFTLEKTKKISFMGLFYGNHHFLNSVKKKVSSSVALALVSWVWWIKCCLGWYFRVGSEAVTVNCFKRIRFCNVLCSWQHIFSIVAGQWPLIWQKMKSFIDIMLTFKTI